MSNRIIVIGAGPAGLMAAISSAAAGTEVCVLEQMPRPGMKLLASGGSKCNLTNTLPVEQLCAEFGRQWRFCLPAVNAFPPESLRTFFGARGVPTSAEDGMHVFPESGRAADVLQALLNECAAKHISIKTSSTVIRLIGGGGKVRGVECESGRIYEAEQVIIATGGKGYPALGGIGIGYKLAEQAGHDIVTPMPAMTGLCCQEQWPGECAGISFSDVEVFIDLPKYRKQPRHGEILFTHKGISGPAVIDFAGDVSQLLTKHGSIPLKIRFFPDKNTDYWMKLFSEWQRDQGKKHLRNLISRHMPQSFADIMLDLAACSGCKAAEFRQEGREKLAALLNATPVTVKGTESWEKAMVTRGGVSLKQVDPETLESRLLSGLYFAGEVLDLDGPCGGFNLQWAFSSGMLAGKSGGALRSGQ